MKNRFITLDTHSIVFATSKGKEFEILIDTSEIELVSSIAKWYVLSNPKRDVVYAYANVVVDGKQRYLTMHRFIMNCKDKNKVVDHLNHNGLDNRKSNLRIATHSENSQNQSKLRSNNSSGYRNVFRLRDTDKWYVMIGLKGKYSNLGIFDDIEEANAVATEARKRMFSYTHDTI